MLTFRPRHYQILELNYNNEATLLGCLLPRYFQSIIHIYSCTYTNPFRQLLCRLIMSAAERLSKKLNILLRSKALRAIVKFWEETFSQGYYLLTYHVTGRRSIYFPTLPLTFILGVHSKLCCLFCTFWSIIWDQLSYITFTELLKMSSFFFHVK